MKIRKCFITFVLCFVCITFAFNNAYEVAKIASNGFIPGHDNAHKRGYFNHFHRSNNGRVGVAHAFYGTPQFKI